MHQLLEKLGNNQAANANNSQQNDAQTGRPPASPEFLMESLANSMTEFAYDPDHNLTFDAWYKRYEDTFSVDAGKLDDAAKVRLLTRKLSTDVHTRYADFILPAKKSDKTFAETVEKLTEMFGPRTSKFNIRYNCLQLKKDSDTDFIAYAGIVNKQCEDFKLSELTLDQFKCLIFVMDLQSSADAEIRTKMLNKLDSESATIKLDAMSTECQRIISLKRDTKMIEAHTKEPLINKVHQQQQLSYSESNGIKANSNNNYSKGKKTTPKSPCWYCGAMHFARDCTFANHTCKLCNVMGHKEGYCTASNKPKANKKRKFNGKHNHNLTHAKTNNVVINNIHAANRKYIQVAINSNKIDLQFDSAADITIISQRNFKLLKQTLQPADNTAESANGSKIPLGGKFTATVHLPHLQKQAFGTIHVTALESASISSVFSTYGIHR